MQLYDRASNDMFFLHQMRSPVTHSTNFTLTFFRSEKVALVAHVEAHGAYGSFDGVSLALPRRIHLVFVASVVNELKISHELRAELSPELYSRV
eukprot:g61752.t1